MVYREQPTRRAYFLVVSKILEIIEYKLNTNVSGKICEHESSLSWNRHNERG
jgi:hypothetical protein